MQFRKWYSARVSSVLDNVQIFAQNPSFQRIKSLIIVLFKNNMDKKITKIDNFITYMIFYSL